MSSSVIRDSIIMSLKSVRSPFLVIFLLATTRLYVSGQDFNYLTYAHETAMNMQYTFEVSLNFFGQFLTTEAEQLSRSLTTRTIDTIAVSSTYEDGYKIMGCILPVSTMSLSFIWDVVDKLEPVGEETVDFHQSVLEELTRVNILKIDFETFYYQFSERLSRKYSHLNDVLLVDVVDSLDSLISGKEFLTFLLGNCLDGVK